VPRRFLPSSLPPPPISTLFPYTTLFRSSYFWCNPLPWCDGRCVQGPGTYSPRHSDPRLLAIPASWSRVADSNSDYDWLYEISMPRSEEHTSELQSRFDLVCRLLLEKKHNHRV